MLKIGLVGTGTMGAIIGTALDEETLTAELAAVTDLDSARAGRFASGLKRPPPVVGLKQLVGLSDLVVEAAGAASLDDILPEVVSQGKDLLVLSVGGLIDREDWIESARGTGSRIYCPSGAIAGLDAVKAAALGRISEACITSRKPPAALAGAPYLKNQGIDVGKIQEPTFVFEGSAREACQVFPENVNVSAALSLAGIGADRTRVRIVADPTIGRNIHEIEIVGDFGRLRTVTENMPSGNPRTSRLAALSAIALVRTLTSHFRVGT